MPEYFFDRGPRPASYEQPNVNFDWLGNLPKSYQEGQQYGVQRKLQTLGQDNPNLAAQITQQYGPLIGKMFQVGGAPAVQQLLPAFIGAESSRAIMNQPEYQPGNIDSQGGTPPNSPGPQSQQQPPGSFGNPSFAPGAGPAASTNGAGPAGISGAPQSAGNNPDAPTVNSIATKVFKDTKVPVEQIRRYATALGVGLDDVLTPEQANKVTGLMGNSLLKTRLASASQDVSGLQGSSGSSGAIGPAASSPAPPSANAPNARGMVAQGPAQTTGQEATTGPEINTRLPGDSNPELARRDFVGQRMMTQGVAMAANPLTKTAGEQMIKKAEAFQAVTKSMRDRLTKEQEMKAGVVEAGQKEIQGGEIKRGQNAITGITAATHQYQRDMKPMLTLSRSILSDPNMYTGFGAERRLDLNKISTAFGGDPRRAQLMEMLQKVTSTNMLSVINTQKDQMTEAGSASSRLFKQQVEAVEKASPALATSEAGNRSLVEIQSRMGELQTAIFEKAQVYLDTHPYLDRGFDKEIVAYMKKNPVFTTQELQHPELLGAPSAPPGFKDKAALQSWGKSLGLNSGDAYRTPTGQIKALP